MANKINLSRGDFRQQYSIFKIILSHFICCCYFLSRIPNSPTGPHSAEFDHVIASPEKLQLDLQRELSGDPSELRSRPWYHGTISRQRAETIVSVADGNFLVRDCISSPGDFVLTCCWRGTPLNFMINAIVGFCIPGQLPPLSYKFEEDAFPTIQQLIEFYQTRNKPVTVVSGALLRNPVPRSLPLSYYDTKYGALVNFASAAASGVYGGTPVGSPKPSPFVTPNGSPSESPDMNRRGVTWTGSQPVLNFTDDELRSAGNNRNSSFAGSRGVGGSDSSRRSPRAPSLDRCDSLPVISVTPPIVGKQTQRPDYTASFTNTTTTKYSTSGNINPPNKNENLQGDSTARIPKPFTTHMRAGSAPALMPTEELEKLRNLHNGSPNTEAASSIVDPGVGAIQGPPQVTNSRRSSSLAPVRQGRGTPLGGRLVSASSESELTNPPPPKPSRIPSVKYKQKPRVVIRRPVETEDDDRDYSDYFQVKEEPSWIHGDSESAPRFREDPPKRLSPSPLAATNSQGSSGNTLAPQTGRRANRIARGGKAAPPSISTSSQLSPSKQRPLPAPPSPSTPTPVMRNANHTIHPPERHNERRDGRFVPPTLTRVPPTHPNDNDTESPPMTPTYQIVARSRSFQTAQSQDPNNFGNDNDNCNNINNAKNKGYRTLPNRSLRSKMSRSRKTSDHSQMAQEGDAINDYDVPPERADDEIPQTFSFPNSNNNGNVWGYRKLTEPPACFPTAIKPEALTSDLLPKGHKALDQSVLLKVKKLLLSKSARQLAMTLTEYDLKLFKVTGNRDLCMGVYSGLELLTLPQGKQLRQDGLERWECLRLFVMTTLLACPTVSERAGLLSLWIQTCLELKGSGGSGGAGNLFSFASIMSGLCGEPVRRLTDTWLILRQMHTSSAYVFDTRLRPALAALNDASADLPVNRISMPYVTPVCRLLEAQGPGVPATLTDPLTTTKLGKDPVYGSPGLIIPPPRTRVLSPNSQREALANKTTPTATNNNINNNNYTCEYYWEAGLDPVGGAVDVLLAHLDTARVIAAQGPLYCSTGEAVLAALQPDADLSAALSAEFHLLLLWGEKGWAVRRPERVGKLQQILTILSNKYQVPGDDGTEV